MSDRFTQKYRHLVQLYQDRGLTLVLCHLAYAMLALLYSRQVVYVTLKRLDRPDSTVEERETECLVVDSPAALAALAPEFPASFRDTVDDLQTRIAQGCVVTVVYCPKQEGGGQEVVGYNLSERGVFSAFGRCGFLTMLNAQRVVPGLRALCERREPCADRVLRSGRSSVGSQLYGSPERAAGDEAWKPSARAAQSATER